MFSTDTAIIGGGQAGLAMSRCLSDRGIDHLVFERDAIGSRWRSHAWDSLRLLTPNWLNSLPGSAYSGDEADGFMARDDFMARLREYARSFAAPVLEQTQVLSVRQAATGFHIATDRGEWRARTVVIATGHCDIPALPAIAESVDRRVASIHASQYRSPAGLPGGGVLVVGASASGVQIADELQRSGRPVTLAVGHHSRLPRTWRGRDVFWWLHRAGVLDERICDMADPAAAKRQPSLQLAGRPDRANIDLATLQQAGVRLVGRLVAGEGDRIALADDLLKTVGKADAKLRRLLARFDAHAGYSPGTPGDPIAPVDLSRPSPRQLSLAASGIRSIVWATGYRRAFPWLQVPVLGPDGDIHHRDGETLAPGMCALGYRLLRKRDSSFIGGVGADASVLAARILALLQNRGCQAA
jgi:putative flavoprotein involved in K+ transport